MTIRARALALYTRTFVAHSGYIIDAGGLVVAMAFDAEQRRLRGKDWALLRFDNADICAEMAVIFEESGASEPSIGEDEMARRLPAFWGNG